MPPQEQKWSSDKVKYWFAITTLVDRALVSQFPRQNGWDEWVVIKKWYDLSWDDHFEDFKTKMCPTGEQMDVWRTVTQQWIKMIDSDTNKRIIWMRACHMSFPKIGRVLRLSRQNIIARYETAIIRLVERLNAIPNAPQKSD